MANYKESYLLELQDGYSKQLLNFKKMTNQITRAVKNDFQGLDFFSLQFQKAKEKASFFNNEITKTKNLMQDITRKQISMQKQAIMQQPIKQNISTNKNVGFGDLAGSALGFSSLFLPVKQAMEMESLFGDIKKVLPNELNAKQIKDVKLEILDLTKTIPVATKDIFQMYGALAQGGIAMQDLKSGTLLASQIQVAMDTTAEEASDFTTKIPVQFSKMFESMNLTTIEGTRLVADYINYAGDRFPAKSKQILNIVQRIASEGARTKFDIKDQVAFATFLTSAGTEAERASTALLNLFSVIGSPMQKKFEKSFSQLGLTGKQVFDMTRQDGGMKAFQVIMDRVKALPEIKQVDVLGGLFGIGTLESANITKIIQNYGDFSNILSGLSNKTEIQGSIQGEYTRKINETKSSVQLLMNSLRNLSATTGNTVLPEFRNLVNELAKIINSINSFVEKNPQLVATLMKIAGALIAVKLATIASSFAFGGLSNAFNLLQNGFKAYAFVYGIEILNDVLKLFGTDIANVIKNLGSFGNEIESITAKVQLALETIANAFIAVNAAKVGALFGPAGAAIAGGGAFLALETRSALKYKDKMENIDNKVLTKNIQTQNAFLQAYSTPQVNSGANSLNGTIKVEFANAPQGMQVSSNTQSTSANLRLQTNSTPANFNIPR